MIIHHTATAGIWCYIIALDFAYQFACIACLVECTTPLLGTIFFLYLLHLYQGTNTDADAAPSSAVVHVVFLANVCWRMLTYADVC
jgi:hypothetical protein